MPVNHFVLQGRIKRKDNRQADDRGCTRITTAQKCHRPKPNITQHNQRKCWPFILQLTVPENFSQSKGNDGSLA